VVPLLSSFETIEAAHHHIRDELIQTLNARCTELMGHWQDADQNQRVSVRSYIARVRNRTLASLMEMTSLDDVQYIAAVQHVELKCRWTVLNARIQAQTARNGQADPSLMYRATGISLVIEILESLLADDQIDSTTAFLADSVDVT
jgi:hypothetical protein